MAARSPTLTELALRYDIHGPRYTSYPTAPQFTEDFGVHALHEAIAAGNGDPIPNALSLYVHVPYCSSPCFYCGCNRVITRDATRGTAYLQRLLREADLLAPLFDRDREVVQLHFGGGTPNFLSPGQLCDTVAALQQRFPFDGTDQRDISIELDPRFIDAEGVRTLAGGGFNRASLGVQDLDPAVQQAVNRVQPLEQTRAVLDACRASGIASINIDLIYGLPRQTLPGFERTLQTVLAMRPDRLAVYSYAHLPQLFKPQRRIAQADVPDADLRLRLMQLAIDMLGDAGYQHIGMDHFAVPDDPLATARRAGSLHRSFMGYSTHAATDLVGLGVSAISHIGRSYSQNPRTLPDWRAAIDAGRLPTWRGMQLSDDDLLRAEVIQELMCHARIDTRQIGMRHGIDFNAYFATELPRLRRLQHDGLVLLEPGLIRAPRRTDGICCASSRCASMLIWMQPRAHLRSMPGPSERCGGRLAVLPRCSRMPIFH